MPLYIYIWNTTALLDAGPTKLPVVVVDSLMVSYCSLWTFIVRYYTFHVWQQLQVRETEEWKVHAHPSYYLLLHIPLIATVLDEC